MAFPLPSDALFGSGFLQCALTVDNPASMPPAEVYITTKAKNIRVSVSVFTTMNRAPMCPHFGCHSTAPKR